MDFTKDADPEIDVAFDDLWIPPDQGGGDGEEDYSEVEKVAGDT